MFVLFIVLFLNSFSFGDLGKLCLSILAFFLVFYLVFLWTKLHVLSKVKGVISTDYRYRSIMCRQNCIRIKGKG